MSAKITSSVWLDASGQELVEAALVLPILCLILFAIFWFGRAFNINSTLERAARQGLLTATHSTCASCGNNAPTNASVVTSIHTVLQADHLKTANVTVYSPAFACTATPTPVCTTQNKVQICTGIPLSCGGVACQTPPVACGASAAVGTRVSFGYQFDLPFPIINLPAFTISASAQSEPEN